MSQTFREVMPQDFSTFGLEKPAYREIEETLIRMGGAGPEGIKLKKAVLKAAGWTYHDLIAYSKFPDAAASAFNRIRECLGRTQEPEQLLSLLASD